MYLVERTVAKSDTNPTHTRSTISNIPATKGLQLEGRRAQGWTRRTDTREIAGNCSKIPNNKVIRAWHES